MSVQTLIKRTQAAAIVGFSLALSSPVYGAIKAVTDGIDNTKPAGAKTELFAPGGVFMAVANTLVFIVGAASVIMLIIGGFRYVLSSGNSSAVSGAKDTILYAIIGLIVASMAFAISHFIAARV